MMAKLEFFMTARLDGLELLHDNVKKYGTVFNTVAPGTDLTGVIVCPK